MERKKEISLCSECAKQMGLDDFEMPMAMDFSGLFGDIFQQYEDASLLTDFIRPRELECENCHMTYEELLHTGKFGCAHCYDAFRDKISPILKNLHGNNKHVGRIGSISKEKNPIRRHEIKKRKDKIRTMPRRFEKSNQRRAL